MDAIPLKNNYGSSKNNSNYKEHIAEPKPTLKGLLNLKILVSNLKIFFDFDLSTLISKFNLLPRYFERYSTDLQLDIFGAKFHF